MISFAKKFLSIALALVLLVGVFPAAAFAAGAEGDEGEVTLQYIKITGKDTIENGYKTTKPTTGGKYTIVEADLTDPTYKVEGVTFTGGWVDGEGNAITTSTTVNKGETLTLKPKFTFAEHTHKYEFDHKILATCTEAGKIVNKCSCGKEQIVDDPEAPALGHDWGEWTVTLEPKVGAEGLRTRTCKRDASHVETEKIAALVPQYTINYDPNMADVATPASKTVYQDGVYPEMPNLGVKNGYTVDHWVDESNNTVKAGQSIGNKGHTLKAIWSAQEHLVRFFDNEGNVISKYTQKVLNGTKIPNVPSATVAGRIDGKQEPKWDTDTSKEVYGPLDIRPVYKNNTYTVIFDYGRSKLENQSYQVENGTRIAASCPNDVLPKKNSTQEVFMYWVDPAGNRIDNETRYDFGKYGSEARMKAVWKDEAVVKVHFYRNGNFTNPIVATLPGIGEDEVVTITKKMLTDLYNNNAYPVEIVGPFSENSWIRYKAGASTATLDQINTVQGDSNGTILYCMVKDNKSNSKPDSSNPKTGDESMILATTTVMLISAGALAVFFANRKRRNG